MSSTISSGPQQIISKHQFNSVYDTYGSVIYGLVLKIIDGNTTVAEMLLQAVFVELYAGKGFDSETEAISFSKILRVTIAVCAKNGYCASALTKMYSMPLNRIAVPASTNILAQPGGTVPLYE